MKHAKDHEQLMYVEIPVIVFFSSHPEEKPTWGYHGGDPGCPAHIIVDDVQIDCQGADSPEKMIMEKFGDVIDQECMEAVKEEEYDDRL